MFKFSKYHGCGKDFVIVNEEDVVKSGRNISRFATKICSRNTGVGADGLIIVRRSPLEMIVINSDGSRATMCGNGIRCFANYCYDDEVIPVTVRDYEVMTGAGVMKVSVQTTDPFVAEINMGLPDFTPANVGCDCASEDLINRQLEIGGELVTVSTMFMGTVHTIVWVMDNPWAPDSISGFSINEKILRQGKLIAEHPVFKEKTNVNFALKLNKGTIKLITYERGIGFTAASGSGACASVVIGALERKLNKSAKVILPYGEINVSLKRDGVRMVGPAERIMTGRYYEDRQ